MTGEPDSYNWMGYEGWQQDDFVNPVQGNEETFSSNPTTSQPDFKTAKIADRIFSGLTRFAACVAAGSVKLIGRIFSILTCCFVGLK